jgi:hypothetical protein
MDVIVTKDKLMCLVHKFTRNITIKWLLKGMGTTNYNYFHIIKLMTITFYSL